MPPTTTTTTTTGKAKGKGLGKKIGPFPLWLWLGAGAGILIVAYLYLRGRDTSAYGPVETVTGASASPEQMAYGGYPSENGSMAGQVDPGTLEELVQAAVGPYITSAGDIRGKVAELEDAFASAGYTQLEDKTWLPPFSPNEAVYDATLGPPGGGVIPLASAIDRGVLSAAVGRGTVGGKRTGGTAIKRPKVPGTPVPGMAGPGIRPKSKPQPKKAPPKPKPVAKAKPKPQPKRAPKAPKKKVPQRARGAGGGTLRAA